MTGTGAIHISFAPLLRYVVSGTTILRELVYDTSSGIKTLTHALYYGYDEAGSISHVTVKLFDTDSAGNPVVTASGTFYYVKNLQGDVTAIVDGNGTVLVRYKYDAWGAVSSTVTAGLTGLSSYIANNNPFRYRGYYYDGETGFYYLNSRYYDPEIGRFLNGDAYVSTGQGLTGYNMYVYCNNNPANMLDILGEDAIYVCDYNSLAVLGHAIVFIQDDNGTWYMTDFGTTDKDGNHLLNKICLSDDYENDPYKYLASHCMKIKYTYELKWGWGWFSIICKMEKVPNYDALYIPGDFSESLSLAEEYFNNGYGDYHFFTHNCLHYAREILQAGDCEDDYMDSALSMPATIIPSMFIGVLQWTRIKLMRVKNNMALFGEVKYENQI